MQILRYGDLAIRKALSLLYLIAPSSLIEDQHAMISRYLPCVLLLLVGTTISAQSMNNPGRVYGTSDQDIPTPVHSLKTASDPGAIQAVIDFVRMTGVAGWTGMTATGTMTSGGSDNSETAELNVLKSRRYRLDVETSSGKESTVYSGSRGVFLSAKGVRSSISSDIAALGLLAYPRLLSPDYPRKTTILTDQGDVSIGGRMLHRITLDDPAEDGTGNAWKTVDDYFDSKTKQLVESVAFVHLSTADAALYTIETTYADYRTVGSATLPYLYSQSLNGNLQWTLQLNTVSLNVTPEASLFAY
jgi:hypothetical protein